jgi:hypothetical protein
MDNVTTASETSTAPDLSYRHGGPHDRGSADAYYGRPKNPHKYAGATYTSTEVVLTDAAEIASYNDGYDTQTDRKDWG